MATRTEAILEFMAKHSEKKPSAIVAGLHEQGIEVSRSLVNKVLYGGKRKGRRRRKAGRPAAAEPAPGGAPAMTGTQAIQEYIRQHPKAGPKEIRQELGAQGVSVSASLVSAVKYRTGGRRGRPTARQASHKVRARGGALRTSGVTVEQLLEVKRIADEIGGPDSLRQALDALEQLR